MKLLMIILDESVRDEVEALLDRRGVGGYTEIPMVLGEGLTGKRLSSRLHPGANRAVARSGNRASPPQPVRASSGD